jgi:hypothetical protein
LFRRADNERNLGRAFRLFLAAAKGGDMNAQARVGHCYDTGQGVRPNRTAALYWYHRAYRRGDATAAHNIGTIWRDEQNVRRAEEWFQRAVRLGHEDAHLDIAKLNCEISGTPEKAIQHLLRVLRSERVTRSDKREASLLLKRVQTIKGGARRLSRSSSAAARIR